MGSDSIYGNNDLSVPGIAASGLRGNLCQRLGLRVESGRILLLDRSHAWRRDLLGHREELWSSRC